MRRDARPRGGIVVALAAASALAVCALTDAACIFPAYSVGDVGGGDAATGTSSATRASNGSGSASGGDAPTSTTGTSHGGGLQTSATGTSVGGNEPVGGAGGGGCVPPGASVEQVECGLPQPVGLSVDANFIRWADTTTNEFYATAVLFPTTPLTIGADSMACATTPVAGGFGRGADVVHFGSNPTTLMPPPTGGCLLTSNRDTAFWLSTDPNGNATHLFKYSSNEVGNMAADLHVMSPSAPDAPVSMTADDAYVYWADSGNGKIYYVDLDGTNLQFFPEDALGIFAFGGVVYYAGSNGIGFGTPGGMATSLFAGADPPTGPLVAAKGTTGLKTYVFWATANGISVGDTGMNQPVVTVATGPVQSMGTDGVDVYWISGHDIWRYPVPH